MAQSTSSGTSSRRHVRDHDTASIASGRYVDAEWEAKEALRQRELEEARARAAQMEKTMRWWSDCTANWREKWSKVRNERNRAREEAKQYRAKLDAALKDVGAYQREKHDLELRNEQLKREMEKIHLLLLKHAGQFDSRILEALESEDPERDFAFLRTEYGTSDAASEAAKPECDAAVAESEKDAAGGALDDEFAFRGAVPRFRDALPKRTHTISETRASETSRSPDDETARGSENGLDERESLSTMAHQDEYDRDLVVQKMSMLQLRLDEATKTIHVEREEKTTLHRTLERLQAELQEARQRCEEARTARHEAARELLAARDRHREELRLARADLRDEASSREGVDRRLADLRAELERLQAENAAEWGKRERLETEKLALERDNKKLRSEVRDVHERLDKKTRPTTTSETELRQLQQDIADRNKEISELKHNSNKMKKVLQDKMTELAHATRRAEQYEAEVKRLRGRVEELKRDLAVAEDEIDTATNNIRKLQRTNDELQEQVDGFQVQLEHLHTSRTNRPDAVDVDGHVVLVTDETLCITEADVAT